MTASATVGSDLPNAADSFGYYHNGAYIPHNRDHHQLRRQHSTDDWISLRSVAREQEPAPRKQFLLPRISGLQLESDNAHGALDNRLT
ncbi:hypothetical protein GGI21_004123, partial [Coemansia aciculifera]